MRRLGNGLRAAVMAVLVMAPTASPAVARQPAEVPRTLVVPVAPPAAPKSDVRPTALTVVQQVPTETGQSARTVLVAPPKAGMDLRALRVCADPNNLPYSNRAGEGFENVIAEMLAEHMNRRLETVWWAQRRGFLGNTIGSGRCDVVMGVPTGFGMLSTSRPYYRSTYVFLTRADDRRQPQSLDDPLLRSLRIGVHLIGDDYANTPGAHALGKRGIRDNVVGFPIYGDYAQPSPPARLVEAVADGTVDVAIIWGPFAGYFGPRQDVDLRLRPVTPVFDPPNQAFVFSMSMGVRRGNFALRSGINEFIKARSDDIDRVLAAFGMPRLDGPRPISIAGGTGR